MANERDIPYLEQRLNTQALHFLLRGQADKFAQLRQRHPDWKPEFVGCVLSGCSLTAFDLSNCHFENTNFGDALCQSTNFSGSEFAHCRFEATDLTGASFEGAEIHRSLFQRAHLEGTSFECAYLGQTDILLPAPASSGAKHSHLRGPNLSRARLVGCQLSQKLLHAGTSFEYTDFADYIPTDQHDEEYEVAWDKERYHGTYVLADADGHEHTVELRVDRLLFTAKRERDSERAVIAKAFAKASWNTVMFNAKLHRRADLLPGSRIVAIAKSSSPTDQASSTLSDELKDGAIRAASEELTLACRDLVLDGVAHLPLSDDTRKKLHSFLKTKSGERLVAALLSFVLQSGVTDYLPLIPEEVKTLLRQRLPRELRVGAMQQIFKELGKLLLGAAGSTIAKLQEATAAPPVPAAEPAQLPEPTAKLFKAAPTSRIRKAPVRRQSRG